MRQGATALRGRGPGGVGKILHTGQQPTRQVHDIRVPERERGQNLSYALGGKPGVGKENVVVE